MARMVKSKQALEVTEQMREATQMIMMDITILGRDNWKKILKQRIMGLHRTRMFSGAELIAIALPIRNQFIAKK